MNPLRSLVPLALLSLAGVAACKSDSPPPVPQPEKTAAAAPVRPPSRVPPAKIDPQALKEYRIDLCYYGTFTFRQAREAYLASLAGAEPSAKKIPSFGAVAPPAPPASASASAAGKPPPPPPGAKPDGGAPDAGSAPTAPDRRVFDFAIRAPHERYARSCSAAMNAKEPPMPEVDAALAAFAPFAMELGKDIVAANTYYLHEEYKADDFAKGKDLHKKLVEQFGKLDALSDAVGSSLGAFRTAHPHDASKMEDGQKLGLAGFEDARALLVLGAGVKKADAEAYKAALAKLDASTAAVKDWSAAHATDAWTKMMGVPLEAFDKTAKDSQAKLTDKVRDADAMLPLVNGFTGLIEGKQRALSRSASSRMQGPISPVPVLPPPGAAPATAAPTAAPAPPAPPTPAPN